MRIELDDVSRPQVLALLAEHLRSMYEITPPDQVFAFDANKLRAPGVVFWTAWEDDVLLGCAALKELSRTQGEVKSMRTPVNLRRRGAGRALLDHIVQVARQRGYKELLLETGSHPAFLPAQALYRSVGFRPCGPFGAYRDNGFSVFMALHLDAESPRPDNAPESVARDRMPPTLRVAMWFAAAFAGGATIILAAALLGLGSWRIGGDAVETETFVRVAGPLLALAAGLMIAIAYGFHARRSWSRPLVVVLWLSIASYSAVLGWLGQVRPALAWRGGIQATALLVISVLYLYRSSGAKAYFSKASSP